MALSGYNTPRVWKTTPNHGLCHSGPSHTIQTTGILSDMDGTLIDSTEAIIKHWERVGRQYDLDPKTILSTSHGRRSIDVFQTIDPSVATWEHVRKLEAQVPVFYGSSAKEIPGAREFLHTLSRINARWAIVTSGTRPLVQGWLKVLNLAEPRVMVTAEDVRCGKPDPECYKRGAALLGLSLSSSRCPSSPASPLSGCDSNDSGDDSDSGSSESPLPMVLEDAPAGIRAGKAAGFVVVALATTHSITDLRNAGADWIVPDLRSVRVEQDRDSAQGLLNVCLENIMF